MKHLKSSYHILDEHMDRHSFNQVIKVCQSFIRQFSWSRYLRLRGLPNELTYSESYVRNHSNVYLIPFLF